jgi:signal transduction histidine kinase
LSSAVTEGVSGAGIGLGLARDLARLHQGELTLVPSDRGACFELSLYAPEVITHARSGS